MPTNDLLELARRSSRTLFIAQCPHLVLVGSNNLHQPPRQSAQTLVGLSSHSGQVPWTDPTIVRSTATPHTQPAMASAMLVMAVRKTQAIFPNMITVGQDRKSTRLNSSHLGISYAVFCLKKKKK